MGRIASPLGQMGARIGMTDGHAPLVVQGGSLSGITYRLPVASAQVKSAVLLAGLSASGTTTVVEPVATRDHTERMLELDVLEIALPAPERIGVRHAAVGSEPDQHARIG